MTRRWTSFFTASLLGILFLTVPVLGQPKVVVVVADHLTLADLTQPGLPGFAQMLAEGQAALMSPGKPEGRHPTQTVYASLGAGDSIRIGSVSQGRLNNALRMAGVRTALIGNGNGDDTGPYAPASLILPSPTDVFDPTVLSPTSPGGRITDPALFWSQTQAALASDSLVVAYFGDFARLQREQQMGELLPSAYQAHREQALARLSAYLKKAQSNPPPGLTLMLVVPTPPLLPDGTWDQLTPFVEVTPGDWTRGTRPHLLLQSETTQTPGLVAARDLAPTLLALLHLPIPEQMTGAPIQTAVSSSLRALPGPLTQIARQTQLNQEAQNPLFWGLGLLAPALIFLLLAAYYAGKLIPGSRLCPIADYAVRLLSSWPLALLLVPLLEPKNLTIYLAEIAALTAAIALLPSPTMIFTATALVLVADGVSGTTLVSRSVLSAYALAGIRFYGIGNEYMGILIGGALLAAGAGAARFQGRKGTFWVVLGWFFTVIVVLSCPAFGAKAGGAITATAIFGLAWIRLRGRVLRFWHAAAGVTAGFLLDFFWAWLSKPLGLRRTHLETAVTALQGGRLGYILGIVRQKLGLALHVFLHPGTLLGLLALFLVGLAARSLFRQPMMLFYASRPSLAAVSEAGLWGGIICVLFNDSGIVAAILLLMCLILPVLQGLFQESCESLPLMSEMSGSVSPSVMTLS